jgi:hypothetical protein
MIFIVYSLLFIFGHFQVESSTLCVGENATSTYVKKYCDEQEGYLVLRCCLSSDNYTFIALDLMGLNLTSVPDFSGIDNFNLSVIDLRHNPQLEPSHNNDDFLTLKYLDQLILPEQFDCPGGHRVWEEINKTSDEHPGNVCTHQKDFCSNSTDICDEHISYCSTNGPNHFLCLCTSDYHGYKCLRNGKFPMVIFFSSTTGVTVLASAFLYLTQRRHVTK